MKTRNTHFPIVSVLLCALVFPVLLGGCASHKSTSSVPLITDDSASTWQNAGTTTPAPASAAPPAPPNTLDPSIATVGGSVSTKPQYAQYDIGWPRIFVSADSTNTLYEPQVESWDGMV